EILAAFKHEQQLKVTAHFSDGSSEDVTGLALFQSNESAYADVDARGKIKVGTIAGEAAVTARFVDKFAVCNVLVPLPEKVDAAVYEKLATNNFIDGLVWNKLRQLNLTPSGPISDSTLHRRAYLGIIGRLPTPDETRAFLADTRNDKRSRLIDALLDRP